MNLVQLALEKKAIETTVLNETITEEIEQLFDNTEIAVEQKVDATIWVIKKILTSHHQLTLNK